MPNPAICRIELSYQARLDVLSDIRDVLNQALTAASLRREDRFRLVTAVDELSTNIARYGYTPKRPGLIDLSLTVESNTVKMRIADRAGRFDPRGGKLPDWHLQVARSRTGGMGRFLVEQMADRMGYAPRKGGGNRVSLVFKLGGFKPGSSA